MVTLTTDFGTRDAFVGVMKGVILARTPSSTIVDLTHEVPPQDVRAAAHALRTAVPHFPAGTIHVAVVDPGVGSTRRALLVATRSALFVAPDNGLVSLVVARDEIRSMWDVSRSPRRRRVPSRTFDGRDVFAPVAAALAAGEPPDALGSRIRAMKHLAPPRLRRDRGRTSGEVVWIDRFGNLITNIAVDHLPAATRVRVGRGFRARRLSVTIHAHVLPLRASYSNVPRGQPVALVNSDDLLEIAVNRGSAAARLGVARGARVRVDAD